MSREEKLTTAEIIYKPLLEDFFSQTWGNTILYSHDIDHHRRVWKYARELFLITGPDDLPAEKLLVASYLHDLGMATDRGERHGSASRELCILFLTRNNMDINHYSDVLDAIENHDDKEYKNPSAKSPALLTILSAADDLDAFGYIGVHRYLEIYLARGIKPQIISKEIIRNASLRFANFESCFGNYPFLIEKHRPRYRIVHDLMTIHNRKADKPFLTYESRNADAGIIQLVSDMVRYNVPPADINTLFSRFPGNMVVTDFIEGILMELKET